MKRIRTLIVDDEPLAREGIAVMLAEDPEIEVIGECADGEDAAARMTELRPDLAFIDVRMPRLSGMEAVERVPAESRPVVVLVTAHHEYAAQAFEQGAAEYVLKPFHNARFQAALRRAKERVRRADLVTLLHQTEELLGQLTGAARSAAEAESPAARRLTFKAGGSFVVLAPEEIVWVEAQGNLVKLCARGRTYLIRDTLEQISRRLDSASFIRVHRSYLVNAEHIREITPVLYGDHVVVMSDNAKIRLSRSYRHQLKSLLPAPPGA